MGARVAVAGASGYAGGELLRLLAGHPDLELAVATADSSSGKTVSELHPHLAGLPGLAGQILQPHGPDVLAGCDLVFLALPAGQSAVVAAQLPGSVKVVDLGPDFRLADGAAWARHYSGPHPGRWVTGTPELPGLRARIRAASRVAAPGCYATAAMLAVTPLVAAGLADPADIVIVAASGTSGAGRSLRTDLLASEVMGSVAAYAVAGAHRHCGRPASVSFTPVLAPMPRGILATCTARLTRPDVSTEELRAAVEAGYDGEPFVTLLPADSWPATASVGGSNGVQLQVAADPRAGRAVAVAALDNLGKGAAGQAVQDANLMLGLAETAGLTAIGVAP
jgi:N-acetyl-gamma-glutamyl-phosphate reductase